MPSLEVDFAATSRASRTRAKLVPALALLATLILLVSGLVTGYPGAAVAADASRFDPGYIVSDENFFDGSAMSGDEVQAFLNLQNRCGAASNCLAAYIQAVPSMPADRYCAAIAGQQVESAASMIARVGAACKMSQKALLVLLQKEQGLVNSRNPSKNELAHATGFACPDTSPCDPAFAGIFYQLYYAARSFQAYKGNPTVFNWYKVNAWNTIRWSTDVNCGTSQVFIRNYATLGLYFYTPYRPNQAALNNLYGTGDACSTYGNRNFWRLWTDWFGDPTVNANDPIGVIKEMWSTEDGGAMWGWALDPDVPKGPVQLTIAVGGVTTVWMANAPYAPVELAVPGAGANHGFGGTVPAPPGTNQEICVTMLNQGGGSDVSLGCRRIDLPPRVSPRGEMKDMWTSVNAVNMWGWAIDPDAVPAATDLHIQVDSKWYVWRADAPYPTGPTLVAGAGPNHGWGGVIPTDPGPHRVCVTAINQKQGQNLQFGCRDVVVPSLADVSPKGTVKEIWGNAQGVSLWGWAVDPDAVSGTVPLVVQVDSNWYAWKADQASPNVPGLFPGAGPNHGWGGTIPASPGKHWVCVYFGNQNQGADVTAGCYEITVPAPPPAPLLTNLMGAWQTPEGITLWGYAIDPDALNSNAQVIVQVDSTWYAWTANAAYAPGASLLPGAGGNNGFVGSVPASPGLHWVCAYSMNIRGDTPPQCLQVRVK